MPTNVEVVQKAYVEFLGRPADVAALEYWTGVLASGAATVGELQSILAAATEFTSVLEGLSFSETVNTFYVQLFGRDGDQAGIDFFASRLENGTLTIAQLIGILGDGAQGADLEALNNKVTAAIAFTNKLDTAAETAGYSSAEAGALAKDFIATITSDASLADALAALPETVAAVTGAPVDHAPTGAVTINGTAIEGQVLSASNTLDDVDGLGSISYQWQAGGVDIAGATGDTFKLTAAQAGKTITVVASYTDGQGSPNAVRSNEIASGNDTLNGSAGADTLAGGTGDDTYTVNAAGDVVVEKADEGTDLVKVALLSGSYTLTANVERATVASAGAVSLVGNALDNVLTGNAAVNTLTGNAGDDTLDGGAGADKLIGGVGNDTYVVDNTGDSITESLKEGTDSVLTALANYTLGSNLENLRYTGSATFTGTGNQLDNILIGGDKSNKLDGGAGNDSLTGGAGNDSLIGGLGNDTLVAGGGKDTVDGGAGTDLLDNLGDFSNYTVSRPTATDTVLTDKSGNEITVRGVENFNFNGVSMTLAQVQDNVSSPTNDALSGTDGNDKLDGGVGADTLSGGLGDDTYVIDNVGDVIVENADEGTDLAQVGLAAAGTYKLADNVEHAIATGTAGVNLTGNALDNKLTGNGAANTLTGGAGNDTLDGGIGADKLIGGTGNDSYVVDNASDSITELLNEGIDNVSTALASYTLSANLENLKYTGTAAFAGTGNALDNEIIGGDKGNKIDGGAGNDQLTGGLGADSLIGGLGNDTFIGAAGKDTIDGGDGSDVLKGLGAFELYTVTRPSATDTVLTDKSGNVLTVRGVESFIFNGVTMTLAEVQDNIASPFNDVLHGSDGDDKLDGGIGADTLTGGAGDDIYVIDNVLDVVLEQADEGSDTVQVALAAAGTYTLAGNVERADVTSAASVAVNLTGNALDNKLTGNGAANTLTGGAGNDTLNGGAGADKLIGGTGDDSYVVDNAGDIVTEKAGEGTDTVTTTLATYKLADEVENLIYSSSSLFTATGNALANKIIGGNGGNKLDGGLGNDTLQGGDGSDNLLGGAGDDVLSVGKGKDTVDGGAGDNDVLQDLGDFDDYTVARPTATDTVLTDKSGNSITVRGVESFKFNGVTMTLAQVHDNVASPSSDNLHGSDGDDSINGGAGSDTMSGGEGNDSYTVDVAGDVVTELADEGSDQVNVAYTAAGTYALTDNVEHATVTSASVAVNLTGNALANKLTGNAAANTLIGGAGNDTLDGAAGADKLIGGSGNDTYVVDAAGDVVTELANEGTDTVQTALASYTLSGNVENLLYTGDESFTGIGNTLGNVITSSSASANDSLQGGAGNDTLNGGLGKDTIDGGADTDLVILSGAFASYTISRPNATDTVLAGKGGFVLTLRNVELLRFADGDKTLLQVQDGIKSLGNDHLYGTSGKDTMDGGTGVDTLAGGMGDDTYIVSNLDSSVVEKVGEGTDLAQVTATTAGTYTLADNLENATITSATAGINLTGNDLRNILTGNAAANVLSGGGGNDQLNGGAGNDTMIGGTGSDTYTVTEAGDVVQEANGEGIDTVLTTLSSYTMGASIEQLVFTGKGAFTGIGNAEADLMNGGDGGAKLDGGANNDFLIGGKGNDSLIGGTGDDSFMYSAGKDTIDGGADNDDLQGLGDFADYKISRSGNTEITLTDKAGNVTIVRNVELFHFADGDRALADTVINVITTGNDKLVGTDGADYLNGQAGADTMVGGLGDDTYIVDNPLDVAVEKVGEGNDEVQIVTKTAGTFVLGDNVEYAVVYSLGVAVNVTGNAADNQLVGNEKGNILIGGAGDDRIDGNGGGDTLIGGTGDDFYEIEQGDVITELAGEGTDTVIVKFDQFYNSYTLADHVEKVYFQHSGVYGVLSVTGNAQDNEVWSIGAGRVILDGGAGNDTVSGGTGDDSLLGGDGDDLFGAIGFGNDTIDGGDGTDTITARLALDQYRVVRTGEDEIMLVQHQGPATTVRGVEKFVFDGVEYSLADLTTDLGAIGDDSLTGTDGDDVLDGGPGADHLAGGKGSDTYVLSGMDDQVVENADEGYDTVELAFTSAATYVIGDNIESAVVLAGSNVVVNVTGNDLDNDITGNGAANLLKGGAGNDLLDGGAGNDTMIGGTGDDVYLVSEAGDVVTELAGEGSDSAWVSLSSYTLGANVENLVYRGRPAAFTGTGNVLDNTFELGGATSAVLDGGAGSDTLKLDLAAADYVVSYAGGVTTLTHDANKITLRNIEFVTFSDGTKSLSEVLGGIATEGNDELHGTAGNDVLDGGQGADTLVGGLGDDTYVVDNLGDVVQELDGEGYDVVKIGLAAGSTYTLGDNVEDGQLTGANASNLNGNALDNTLSGNSANNVLNGGAGDDTLFGNAGNDSLVGGTGDDYLDGGVGNDTLVGGSGDNTYVVDVVGDKIVDGTIGDDVDSVVVKTQVSYTLAADLDNLKFSGSTAFAGTGNATNNVLEGGIGNDVLKGLAGSDTLIGGTGSDTLTGGTDIDYFVFDSTSGSDTVTDFVSGVDNVLAKLGIGNGDAVIDGGVVRAAKGGFSADAELVIFTPKMATASTANAAAVIGSATGNYEVGDAVLFAVSTGSATVLYRFVAANGDAVVSAAELTQVATLTGTPTVALDDFIFG
jgi:Ca2+-binding RTX toxin-like protein